MIIELTEKHDKKPVYVETAYITGMKRIKGDADEYEEEMLVLREDFDQLVKDIREMYISNKHAALISWLINRAFLITSGSRSKAKVCKTTMNNNRVILLNTLYNVNKEAFLKCFQGRLHNTLKD